MNEYNHHRIIERCGFDASVKIILLEASDFTDDCLNAKSKYFFYRNYYTIKTQSNTIRLNRVDSNGYGFSTTNNSKQNINNSGEKLKDGSYSLGEDWSHWTDEKEFFSAVNERRKSAHSDVFDTGNQSDNVAFLHAMGAEGETSGDTEETTEDKDKTSRSIFVSHLKKCFSEYLFLEDEEKALFILGIAFHGIMDSFTPSHMGFQKYSEQDMGLHAQGDVIPIMGFDKDGKLIEGNSSELEVVHFDPGQYTKEGFVNQEFIRKYKYFDGDDYLNPIEKEMFRIFLYISDIQAKDNDGKGKSLNVEAFLKTFNNNNKEINSILEKTLSNKGKETNGKLENNPEKKDSVYWYGPKSYAYSEAAITVIWEVYELLSESRKAIQSYDDYIKYKKDVEKAVNIWQEVYDGKRKIVFCIDNGLIKQVCNINMAELRSEHLKHDFYSKKMELESYKTEVELEKSRARIYSPVY